MVGSRFMRVCHYIRQAAAHLFMFLFIGFTGHRYMSILLGFDGFYRRGGQPRTVAVARLNCPVRTWDSTAVFQHSIIKISVVISIAVPVPARRVFGSGASSLPPPAPHHCFSRRCVLHRCCWRGAAWRSARRTVRRGDVGRGADGFMRCQAYGRLCIALFHLDQSLTGVTPCGARVCVGTISLRGLLGIVNRCERGDRHRGVGYALYLAQAFSCAHRWLFGVLRFLNNVEPYFPTCCTSLPFAQLLPRAHARHAAPLLRAGGTGRVALFVLSSVLRTCRRCATLARLGCCGGGTLVNVLLDKDVGLYGRAYRCRVDAPRTSRRMDAPRPRTHAPLFRAAWTSLPRCAATEDTVYLFSSLPPAPCLFSVPRRLQLPSAKALKTFTRQRFLFLPAAWTFW